MAHTPILQEPLYPPGIPFFCRECANQNKHVEARYWIVCPDGLAISKLCAHHGTSTIFQYRNNDLLGWSLHDLHHADASDRTTHTRPPICGHSVCRQVFIDTGENKCIEGETP